jgi:hypothetical protein
VRDEGIKFCTKRGITDWKVIKEGGRGEGGGEERGGRRGGRNGEESVREK